MNADDKDLLGKCIAVLVLRYLSIPADAIALILALFQGTYNLHYIMVLIGVAPMFIYLYSYALDRYSTVYIDGYDRDTAKEHKVYNLITDLESYKHFTVIALFGGAALLIIGGIVFGLFHVGLFIVELALMCLLTCAMWTIGLNLCRILLR